MKKKKTKPGKFRSRIAAAIHETVAGLHRAGLMDQETIRASGNRGATPTRARR
jgi:DNA-binding transcriptional regulator YiaG